MTEHKDKQLLELPLDLILNISKYLSFSDLWYLSTSSQHCKKLGHRIIWHKYHIDLSKPQLNGFSHLIYGALAYLTQHCHPTIDSSIVQSVSNRLAVEIYDRSPLKNWEPSLDFLLDKTLGIVVDHVFLDAELDIIPYTKEFQPTKMGQLISLFLNTLYPTLTALFDDTEITSKIHHRILMNHIKRHLHTTSTRYHQFIRKKFLSISPTLVFSLRTHFRILVRFIGTLVQTDLLSVQDLDTLIRQQIHYFSYHKDDHKHKRVKLNGNNNNNDQQLLQLEEIEFQMEIFLDLTRAVFLLQQHTTNDLKTVSNMLQSTVSTLISTKKSNYSTSI
ncbi:hypothetical protein G6F70_002806 [Rhizopus microsporus]|uniref:F-box domain-containing protein n=2 Tax=Rhizopus TaxID=4842 RepID=A0A367IWU7_RHIAZ|nr:hypothetical protein G6F71_001536 [Rhizopus microsporus]RCH82132.1 hypothetical protein CU097_002024 [Rhizopus azygosporus]KAG1201852.1 hypothetical protein G6F70_002806 [Rhizopus microsporus]KAG1210616.1 hypothetical protein G6F69_005335 [Rhizopus microsporus]KAG1236013.1 hypothetical protein G6F67_002296 [Rhizopus microsporus]